MAVDLLRAFLDLREARQRVQDIADAYGYDFPELGQIDTLERAAFERANEWDKP